MVNSGVVVIGKATGYHVAYRCEAVYNDYRVDWLSNEIDSLEYADEFADVLHKDFENDR